MNMRHSLAVLAVTAALVACSNDGTATEVGGNAFEAPFTPVAAVRYPTIKGSVFGRSINNAAVVDSVVGEIALAKQLDGKSRYQFYLVNGLDSTATPVSHLQWIVRTDTVLDANGAITTPVDTNRSAGVRDFWRGGFFGQKLRYKITLSEADSVHQRGGWLVLTIQADSTSTRYNDSTPKPLFIRIRDQKGSATRNDDELPADTARGSFGEFRSPARQTRYAATGTGSLVFWDVVKNGNPAIRVEFSDLAKPPRGYYYQPYIIDSLTGIAYAWGQVYDAAGKALADADLGTDSIIPTLRAVQPSNGTIGPAENYTRVDMILEPKTASPLLRTGLSLYSAMSTHRATLPAALTGKRAALGTLQVIVTHGTQGGAAASGVGVVVQAAGNSFNQLVGYVNSDSLGTAKFTGMPVGELRVLAIPFGGRIVETRATITSAQTTTVRLVVP